MFKFRPALFGSFFASSLLFCTSIDSTALKAVEKECAQSPLAAIHWPTKAVTRVNEDNYALAETQVIFADYVKKIAKNTCSDGVGVFWHMKGAMDPNDRTILRPNFDTLYSALVLDLSRPATISMPGTKGRYQSALVISEEHYMPMTITSPGAFTLTKENVGTQYALVLFRTGVNMRDPADMAKASALQDQLGVYQTKWRSYNPTNNWDMAQILAMRKKVQGVIDREGYKSEDVFGKKGELTADQHRAGPAMGWGGLPKDQAVYPFYTPTFEGPNVLTLKDVPVDGFWSITVYDKDGFVQGDAYNINSAFAEPNADGAYVIHFGGDPSQSNHLGIYQGWSFVLRMYQPQKAYFNGSWQLPELVPVK